MMPGELVNFISSIVDKRPEGMVEYHSEEQIENIEKQHMKLCDHYIALGESNIITKID